MSIHSHKIVAFILALSLASPSWALPAYVQGISPTLSGAAQTFGSNTAAGNMIVATVFWPSTASLTGISDTQSNSFSTAATNSASPNNITVYYALNIAGGSDTVTVTFTGTGSVWMIIEEFSGVKTASALDGTSVNSGTGTTPDSGSATTHEDNELIFGASALNNHGTNGASFNFGDDANRGNIGVCEYKIGSPAGSFSADFVNGSSSSWNAVMVTFGQAVAAATSDDPTWFLMRGSD